MTTIHNQEIEKELLSPKHHLRLSMRGRLTLGLLIGWLPIYIFAIWQTWETPFRWQAIFLGALSVGIGESIVSWAYQPMSKLADRARSLAGLSTNSKQLLGLIRTDVRGEKMLDVALYKIEQRLQEFQAINRIGHLVATRYDLEDILTGIIEETVSLLKADAGFVGSWDEEKMILRDIAACNLPIIFPGREFGARDSFSSQVAIKQKPVYIEDYFTYVHRIRELDRFRLRGAIGVPMMVGDNCVGTICVFTVSPSRRFSHLDGQLLMAFASQAAAAFEKARLHQLALDQLEALSIAREELARKSHDLEQALSTMVHVQEEERARIAADVHDGVVQMMVGSLFEVQAAMAHVPDDPEMVNCRLERSRHLVRESITELRRVIYDLRPITLDTAGLLPAIENLREDLGDALGVRINFSARGVSRRLGRDSEIVAYRIVQEAVNNALKHAQAKQVNITLHFSDQTLEITVDDDGKGFSMQEETIDSGDHAGLIGMRERARSLGGHLSVESGSGSGTIVRAIIPHPQPEPSHSQDEPIHERGQNE